MSKEYNQYLKEHKENVTKAYRWLSDNFPATIFDSLYERQICLLHDQSKLDDSEYDAYDAYFYGNDQSYRVLNDFNKAWLNHIHKNPHHWQYWVLNNDDPKEGEDLIDMEYKYILEMLCDWWSFCWKDGNLFGIFDWYNERKSYLKLSDKTRYEVEEWLKKINDKLKENGGM